jgi:hypothetical protein
MLVQHEQNEGGGVDDDKRRCDAKRDQHEATVSGVIRCRGNTRQAP